jgi:hypothetical protein
MLLTLGGFLIWALVDAFLLPSALRRKEDEVLEEVLLEIDTRRSKE